jgi:hypothetical protein
MQIGDSGVWPRISDRLSQPFPRGFGGGGSEFDPHIQSKRVLNNKESPLLEVWASLRTLLWLATRLRGGVFEVFIYTLKLGSLENTIFSDIAHWDPFQHLLIHLSFIFISNPIKCPNFVKTRWVKMEKMLGLGAPNTLRTWTQCPPKRHTSMKPRLESSPLIETIYYGDMAPSTWTPFQTWGTPIHTIGKRGW